MSFDVWRSLASVLLAAAVCCGALRPALAEEPAAAVAAQTRDSAIVVATAAAEAASKSKTLRTRFIIGLDRKAEFQILSLANPNRVVVELPEVRLRLPNIDGAATGLVKSARGGLTAPGSARVVIEVSEPVVVESATVVSDKAGGFQLALDILPVDAALKSSAHKAIAAPSGLGAGGLQPPMPRLAESPRARAAKAFKPVIVLDPGHGGDDSGAVKAGTVEKDVVLAFAHVLREELEKTGRYRVLMTRDKDFFVELDERRDFGERNKANLFIAIHADYAGTQARGATIFTLRDRVAADLKRSAKDRAADSLLTPNQIDTVKKASGDVDAVKTILADLAERDVELTHERTSVFAKSVIETMSENTPMRSEPDQQAAFRVLKTAQFPSVLIELAYVSNQQDARNLKSDAWREKVADSIVSAIENYFSNELARLPM